MDVAGKERIKFLWGTPRLLQTCNLY